MRYFGAEARKKLGQSELRERVPVFRRSRHRFAANLSCWGMFKAISTPRVGPKLRRFRAHDFDALTTRGPEEVRP
jgi:hypothetical protein